MLQGAFHLAIAGEGHSLLCPPVAGRDDTAGLVGRDARAPRVTKPLEEGRVFEVRVDLAVDRAQRMMRWAVALRSGMVRKSA
jgi:hypothetical protein